jgi:hypothetical protein
MEGRVREVYDVREGERGGEPEREQGDRVRETSYGFFLERLQ